MNPILWRHKKTGGLYTIIAEGCIEATLARVVIYRGTGPNSGDVWVRPLGEFHDGRFEKVDPNEQIGAGQ